MSKILTPFERNLKEKMADYEMPYEQRSWFLLSKQMNAVNAGNYPWIVALVATILVTAGGAVTIYRHRHVPSTAHKASTDSRFENNTGTFGQHNTSNTDLSNTALYADNQLSAQNNLSGFNNTTTGSFNTGQNSNNSSENNFSNGNSSAVTGSSSSNSTANSGENVQGVNVQGENSGAANDGKSKSKNALSPEDILDFEVAVRTACVGEEVEFKVTQGPDTEGYLWDFGDNHYDKDSKTPKHKFMKAGTYDVSLSITNAKGQINTAVANDMVTILDSPDAAFNWEFINTNPAAPEIRIVNNSENASAYTWTFSDGSKSTDANPTYKVKPSGKQTIALNVINENGCSDVIVKQISVNTDFKLDAPGSFSSGSEMFMPLGLKQNKVNFVMSIFSKQGVKVYETSSRLKGWDGKLPDGTFAIPGESYDWKIVISNDLTKEQKYFNGTLTVSP